MNETVVCEKLRKMSAEDLWSLLTTRFGREPRIIDAHSGDEITFGGAFESPEGPATLVRFGSVIVRSPDVGVYGIFRVEATGEEKPVPLRYSWDHPSFPGELILFIPS